ncbi:hypothetical protein [Thiothrix subterranea]|nr:hypothetical protein [Thiothrix subterranea]
MLYLVFAINYFWEFRMKKFWAAVVLSCLSGSVMAGTGVDADA